MRAKPREGPRASEQVRWARLGPGGALLIAWLALAAGARARAYQLGNNLIANNLPPRFVGAAPGQASNSEIVVRVKEGASSIGKLIYTLRAEDPDEDPLTFGLLGSLASELLRIENLPANQANVYLRKELDRETTESYQVVITLTDGKLGRGNWITKSMLIIVEDVNDNSPVFGPHRTAISIREDARVPLLVETIEASDQDEGRFGQIIYRLEELDEGSNSRASSGMFTIETLDGKGLISLVQPLDYEQKALYRLRVVAVDRATEQERLSASTSIMVSVEDCEDQAPLFTFVPSITRVPENLPVGSPVVRLAAIDGDRGINNAIQYRLVSVNGQESGPERQMFAINQESGLISVAQELDRESGADMGNLAALRQASQPGSYVLQVRAEELGSNQDSSLAANSVSTELTIILTDVNDELPSFSQAHYYAEIVENSAPESLVTFVPGPSAPSQASSAGAPELLSAGLSPMMAPLARVVDRDQGTNGTFTLHLEGEHSQLFEVWPREATNEANFVIKIGPLDAMGLASQQLLDYEYNKLFQLSVVAREKYASALARSNRAQISVYLRDANDNYPQFEQDLYRVEMPENAIKGMHLCNVRATDPDSGSFGSQGIRYTELRGEKAAKFRLDPLTGAISLKTSEHGFDREAMAQHHLIVEARDANGAGNRNTSQLLIVLTDVNDQRPKFLLDQYEASIYENELDFQTPLQVQALDMDAAGSPNSQITYSIVAGDPQHNFTIDPFTGRIRVLVPPLSAPPPPPPPPQAYSGQPEHDNGPSEPTIAEQKPQVRGLDFEKIAQKRDDDVRQFNLTVRATDRGLPEPLSDHTQVTILVYDKNDHAPVFSRSLYSKSIREDAKEGSQVVQVSAHDGDHSPTNSKVTYRISAGAADKFIIDSDSGLISVANGANLDIDRVLGGQRRTNYLLTVIAFDGSFGSNQKSASALVNITIIDVNNKPPEFVTMGSSRVSIQPANSGGSAALAPNNQQVVYVNEDAPYGLIVTRVVAIDLDSSAELRYSINYALSEARNEDMILVEPSLVREPFSIEANDGTIKVARQLDRELFDQIKLRIQVEDTAAQTPDQIAHTYLLFKITDVNDNRPSFKRPVYKAVVNENSISGTLVTTITADDRDLNKTLKYSLDGMPEMLRLIRINPKSGEVAVNDKIDRELYSLINVTVKAEDYGQPHALTGSAQLLITVRDENDNNPIFMNGSQWNPTPSGEEPLLQSAGANGHHARWSPNLNGSHSTLYRHRSLAPMGDQGIDLESVPLLGPGGSASVQEDAPIGQAVAQVRAEDADVGNNGRVTYLLDAASSGAKFRVDRDSGLISVASSLDRESKRLYTLIIEACDNYDLGYSTGESRRAFTQVNILITDTNDNVPIISTNLQTSLTGSPSSAGYSLAYDKSKLHSSNPSHDDIFGSPGPYEIPLPECLFINEFQSLNEPILTIMATDADDPNTPNGKLELSIINNVPQNELFALIDIPASSEVINLPKSKATISGDRNENSFSASTDLNLNFGPELALAESAVTAVVNESPKKTDSEAKPNKAKSDWSITDLTRPKRSASELSPAGNQYSIHQRTSPFSSLRRSPMSRSGDIATSSSTESPGGLIMSATMASVRHPSSVASSNPEIGEHQAHLVVTRSLKERVGNYSILVRAIDHGQPPLSSIKVINVCVQDVNNHAPIFVKPALNHTIRVLENATLGTFVTQLEATDADHGLNGQLQYFLKPTNIQNSNNDWQSFKIDRLTGTITTAKLFNRQVKKYYTLRVQAQDFGRPTTLSNDMDINIIIVNSGQYQPEFETQLQNLQFTENIAPGTEWAILAVTNNQDDALASSETDQLNGKSASQWVATPCYFIIDSDDTEQIFHLDRYTHRLTNQREIDRERKANYTLLVQATNNCNKAPEAPIYSNSFDIGKPIAIESFEQQSTTTVNPLVALKYRNSDSLAPELIASKSLLRHKRSDSITLASPSLQSRGKKSIEHHMTMNRTSVASLASFESAKLTSESESGIINQAAIDALIASDKSLLKVSIRIKDINDNAPRFTQHVYTGGITTEADFGTVFMIVQAIDLDADANSQVTYSITKPIKRNSINIPNANVMPAPTDQKDSSQSATISPVASNIEHPDNSRLRQRRSTANPATSLVNGFRGGTYEDNLINDIPLSDGDDLFKINSQTGEISLNFDPQKHMKGYFEFDIMANDTGGLSDSAKVFIYLLRQDQRVKFVLRLTPQELRQRLNKFRSVFGNITGAIVNIDSYKYYENHDGSVDKKKTSLYLHFVNSTDNTIIEVDKVLTMIDENIEYLDELYKEFHVLSSEAAHLPLTGSALIDPIDQVRTGLLGIASFLALILVLVIALCLNQRTRYERQLKAATVSAFGSSALHLDPDYHSQTNLPNTNLHSQDPNPIWMNGYNEQDWLGNASGKLTHGNQKVRSTKKHRNQATGSLADRAGQQPSQTRRQLSQLRSGSRNRANDDVDYLSSENSDSHSLSGINSVSQVHYNATSTVTPRDSLDSSQGRRSNSGSGSASTTNERQALCINRATVNLGMQQPEPMKGQHEENNNNNNNNSNSNQVRGPKIMNSEELVQEAGVGGQKKRSQTGVGDHSALSQSTFGAFKEVTIYTEHQPQHQKHHHYPSPYGQQNPGPNQSHLHQQNNQQQQPTSQVNKIASQFNAKHQAQSRASQNHQIYISQASLAAQHEQPGRLINSNVHSNPNHNNRQRIQVHANGADLSHGIIKLAANSNAPTPPVAASFKAALAGNQSRTFVGHTIQSQHQQYNAVEPHQNAAEDFESNLSKLSILNLETTEL